MTADKILDIVIYGLMFGDESEKQEYAPQFLKVISVLVAQNFNINNALREARGKGKLEEIPKITALTDDIDFESEFTTNILPLGAAGIMFAEDDDNMRSVPDYRQMYETERSRILIARHDTQCS